MVIAQLAGLGGETQVRDGGNGNVGILGIESEAVGPGILRLVLQVQRQGLVLEVGEAELSRDGGVAQAASGAASQLVGLAVVGLVVGGRAVAHHGHDVGEGNAGAVVLVCVDEDTETLEAVGGAEDRALGGALLGEPEGEAIAVEVALAVNLEFKFDLEWE